MSGEVYIPQGSGAELTQVYIPTRVMYFCPACGRSVLWSYPNYCSPHTLCCHGAIVYQMEMVVLRRAVPSASGAVPPASGAVPPEET